MRHLSQKEIARRQRTARLYDERGHYVGVPERHQAAIARADAQMPEALRAVLSGPATKDSPMPYRRSAAISPFK